MKIVRLILLFVFVVPMIAVSADEIRHDDVSTMLRRLDKEVSRRNVYLKAKRERIDSLRKELAGVGEGVERVIVMDRLGREYAAYNNDSAIYFFDNARKQARTLGRDSLAMASYLRMLTFMPLAGFYDESEERFKDIDTTLIPRALMPLYYDSGRQMYSYTSAYFRERPEVFKYYQQQAMEMQLGLISSLPADADQRKLNLGEYYYTTRDYTRAATELKALLAGLEENDNMYARASHILSSMAMEQGRQDEYLYYLLQSAISDLKGGTLEVTSLQELGQQMYNLGDIERAHNYLMLAHQNAVECHAMLRVLESSKSMPLIERAHASELENGRHFLVGLLIVMAVMLLGMIVLVMVLRKDMVRLRNLKERLREANDTKELYITQFLNLCSIYMDKLNQFCKIAHRKISTGKVDDLYKLTKSGKFVEEQSREFYEVFDEAFLHIYPSFISDVNALLRPDGQIEIKEGEQLNTDLRILAFMRLGIEESTKIAQVLNYSVYTIYTYRNKLKNRAINRDTFEADVMRIGSVD